MKAAQPGPAAPEAEEPTGSDDLDRGRTVALLASLGRVQLTLDLIERRLGRLEEAVRTLSAAPPGQREIRPE